MANGQISGPPQVDFYSMLSGLGDTIAKNRAAQAERDAFAQAMTPGADGNVDYAKAILTPGLNPHTAAVLAQVQNHQDALKQQNYTNAHQATRDKIEDDWADTTRGDSLKQNAATLALQKQAQDRLLAQEQANAGKPVPFETLGGTHFMVRQPDGSWGVMDPRQLPPGGAAMPAVAPAASPAGMPVAPPVIAGPGPAIAPPSSGAPPMPQPAAPDTAMPAAPPAAPPNAPVPAASAEDINAIDPATGRREAWLKKQDPQAQDYIRKVADYQIDPRTSSTKGGHREQIMSAVAQYDPAYDQNTFGSRSKAIRDFSTGTQGNSIRSFDVATDHLDTLQKYVEAAKNGDYRVINSLRQKWLQETGSPLPTNIQAVAPIVGAEVSKAIIGSNNALADREELRKPLNSANSPDQLMGAIQAYKALMTGQLRGLGKQFVDTTGKKQNDFNNRLRPNTRQVLMGESGGDGPEAQTTNVTGNGVKWSIQ